MTGNNFWLLSVMHIDLPMTEHWPTKDTWKWAIKKITMYIKSMKCFTINDERIIPKRIFFLNQQQNCHCFTFKGITAWDTVWSSWEWCYSNQTTDETRWWSDVMDYDAVLIGGETRITPSPRTNNIGIFLFVDWK